MSTGPVPGNGLPAPHCPSSVGGRGDAGCWGQRSPPSRGFPTLPALARSLPWWDPKERQGRPPPLSPPSQAKRPGAGRLLGARFGLATPFSPPTWKHCGAQGLPLLPQPLLLQGLGTHQPWCTPAIPTSPLHLAWLCFQGGFYSF